MNCLESIVSKSLLFFVLLVLSDGVEGVSEVINVLLVGPSVA